jgi:glycine/D-amino acid oxidase-like deaminating enzyme
LAAVEALVDRGLSVVGVDAGRVAAGAAGRNGGFLSAGPALSFHRAVDRWGVVAADLYRDTIDELDRLHEALGSDVIRRVGSIRLAGLPGEPTSEQEAEDRVLELADCAAQAVALREHGFAVEEYDGPLGSGLFLPDDAATNPAVRAIRLATQIAPHAALHEHTRALEIGARRVVTGQGVVSADVVVAAVDGQLDVLLPQLSSRVRTARLQMLSTRPVGRDRLPCPTVGRWGYDFAHQLPDGRLFVGGGRDHFLATEWTTDTSPTDPVQTHIESIGERMVGSRPPVAHRWAASVGFTDDARPLCTIVDDGVVAVGGYNGTGNLVGPLAARAAVDRVVDGRPAPEWCAS